MGVEGRRRAVETGDLHPYGLAGRQVGEAPDGDAVVGADGVVVRRVGEGERQHALFLQVGLGDAGEGAGDHGHAAPEAGFHCGVFPGGALAVVGVADGNPRPAGFVVALGDLGVGANVAVGLILALADQAAEGVDEDRAIGLDPRD